MSISERFMKPAREVVTFIHSRYPELGRNGWIHNDNQAPLNVECIATCLAFIENGPVILLKTAAGVSSYGGKYEAQRWGRRMDLESYVANGEFLAACLALDIPCKLLRGTPNSVTGVRVLDRFAIYHGSDYGCGFSMPVREASKNWEGA